MMKKIKLGLWLLLLVGCRISTLVAHPVIPVAEPLIAGITTTDCDLPAPGNLHVTSTTTTSASLAWDPVVGAYSYHVELFIVGQPAATYITDVVSPNVTVPIGNANAQYLVNVAAQGDPEICPKPSSNVASSQFSVIIGDLIADLNESLPSRVEVTQNAQSITVPWNENGVYYLDVIDIFGRHAVYKIIFCSSTCLSIQHHVRIEQVNVIGIPLFQTWASNMVARTPDSGNQYLPPERFNVEAFAVTKPDQGEQQGCHIFDVYVSAPNNTAVTISYEYSTVDNCDDQYNFTLIFYCPLSGLPPGKGFAHTEGSGVSGQGTAGALIDAIVQNPFDDNLLIRTDATEDNAVAFKLLSLDGKTLLDQQFPAAQEYNLPTAHIPPGFYVLRMESGGRTQNFKVVKSR